MITVWWGLVPSVFTWNAVVVALCATSLPAGITAALQVLDDWISSSDLAKDFGILFNFLPNNVFFFGYGLLVGFYRPLEKYLYDGNPCLKGNSKTLISLYSVDSRTKTERLHSIARFFIPANQSIYLFFLYTYTYMYSSSAEF